MIEKKFVELQNGDVVEIHMEYGRWRRLVAGSEEYGEWEARIVEPEGAEGWTVSGRNPDGEQGLPQVIEMGRGRGLDYEAAAALAMGFMASRCDEFDYFDGKPFVCMHNPSNGMLLGEALPESKAKREVRIEPDESGAWVARCHASYWDEEHRYFMMRPLEIVLGAGRKWDRERARAEGLHWLVHASFIGKIDPVSIPPR